MVDELNMKRVPERRFPEFKNDGEWEESLFTESFDFLPNNTLSRADLNYNAGIVRNVHYGDVLIKFGNCLDVKECDLPFITNEKVTEKISQSKLKNGDVVIADTAEDEMVGKCSEITNLTDEIVVSGLHTIPIRPIGQFAPLFLGFYLNSESYRRQLIPLMQGIKVVALSKGAFSKTKILYPKNLAEQKKIADSLSFLDGSISLVKKKLELLKLQKKGLMQKLFPAQGEKIPKYRFKEFENDGEWVENKLGNIISTISPLKKLQLKEYKKEGKYPIVDQSQNFICGYSNDSDAVINVASEKLIVFGDHTCTLKFVDFPFIQGADGIKIFKSLYSDMVDVCFLYQFLLCFPIVSKEYKRHFSELKEKIVCYPQNVKEQNRIATCLFIIDECINQFENKITWLELCKKGLMQQLFPLT